jgi:hypothetical protein
MSQHPFGSMYRRTSRRRAQQSRLSMRPVSALESLEDRLLLSASCVISCAASVCQSSKCAPSVCNTGGKGCSPCSQPTCSTKCNPCEGNKTECGWQAIAGCFSNFGKCDPCNNKCSSQCSPCASKCDPCGDKSESCDNNDSCGPCRTKCDSSECRSTSSCRPCESQNGCKTSGDGSNSPPACTKQAA